jgi:hypothetical protein
MYVEGKDKFPLKYQDFLLAFCNIFLFYFAGQGATNTDH